MRELASYDPDARGRAVLDLDIQAMTADDVAACAALAAVRSGNVSPDDVSALEGMLSDRAAVVSWHVTVPTSYGNAEWLDLWVVVATARPRGPSAA